MSDETPPNSDHYTAAHEHLARLGIEATDRNDFDVLEEIVERADSPALLLAFAIAFAEEGSGASRPATPA